MVKLSFSLALFALLPNSVLGVKDYSCCKKECDNQDYDESFGDNQQKCRDIDVNPLNGGVCDQGAPYWTRGLSYPCKKVICCTEDNCKGACTEDRHVSGGCTEDNKFVCDATGKEATKCCNDDTCAKCDFHQFIFEDTDNTCLSVFNRNWQQTACAPVDKCCLNLSQPPFDGTSTIPTCESRCQSFQYTAATCLSRTKPAASICEDSSADGDPHIMLWSHKWVDFHGACDLVLVDHPTFKNGLGVTIHARTTRRYNYSFISSAVIKIGEDILEVFGFGGYIYNGVSAADTPVSLGDFSLTHTTIEDKNIHIFEIALGGEEKVVLRTYKDIVGVKILNGKSFSNSVGLMGEFGTGKMLARDGQTILDDPNEFGEEWQVRESEAGLFQSIRSPQYPEKCVLPSTEDITESRRLGEASVGRSVAERACAWWGAANANRCVSDVLATGDVGMADLGP